MGGGGDCLTAAQVRALAGGGLPAAEKVQLEAHLAGCSACRARFELAAATVVSPSDASDPTRTAHTSRESDSFAERVGIPPLPRDLYPGYEVLEEVGRSGQGIVYKAIQKSTRRKVALKVLNQSSGSASERQRKRFEREVGLLARLNHPHIVTIYDSGLTAGKYFYAMEYIHGRRLDEYVEQERLSVEDVLRLYVPICDAVHHAHVHGIVHRDLKPANILVDTNGTPYVLDFGVAKTGAVELLQDGGAMTATREFVGTITYAAPEQTMGDPAAIDQRADVYALGLILYRLIAGKDALDSEWDLERVVRSIRERTPSRPSSVRPGVSADLDTVILKAMAKEKADRYQSAAALRDDLERLLRGESVVARRESAFGVVRREARQTTQRHPWAAGAMAAALSVLIAIQLGIPAVFQWTPLNQWFENWATPAAATLIGEGGRLQHVRIVPLPAVEEIDAVAKAAGVEGVRGDDIASWRRLHGRLMETLAGCGVKAVVWDIGFPSTTAYDADFVRGVLRSSISGADRMDGQRICRNYRVLFGPTPHPVTMESYGEAELHAGSPLSYYLYYGWLFLWGDYPSVETDRVVAYSIGSAMIAQIAVDPAHPDDRDYDIHRIYLITEDCDSSTYVVVKTDVQEVHLQCGEYAEVTADLQISDPIAIPPPTSPGIGQWVAMVTRLAKIAKIDLP